MKVLSFFAHPDDETMLAGGIFALLAHQGIEIHYLCATRGEGGEVGEPPLVMQDQLGILREKELFCAVHALGEVGSLRFLDYLDPLVGPGDTLFPFTEDKSKLAHQIAEIIQELEIDIILTHGSNGEYGHPAHVLCHQATILAVKSLEQKPIMYTIQGFFEQHPKPRLANQDDPADLIIDVSTKLENKIKAAQCHKSQNALFMRRTSEGLDRPVKIDEVVMKIESLHRKIPKINPGDISEDSLYQLLKKYLVEYP